MQQTELDNPLWQFACRYFAQPGMAEELIALQDSAGININLVLAAIWLGQNNLCWHSQQLDELIQRVAASEAVVMDLRKARRALKVLNTELYQQAKALELNLEQWQLAIIYQFCNSSHLLQADKRCEAANMETYFHQHITVWPTPALTEFIHRVEHHG